MPIYEYRCPNGHLFELFQRIDEPPPEKCEVCGASPVERVFRPVPVFFKGSGFYSTDYGRRGKRKVETSGSDGAKGTVTPVWSSATARRLVWRGVAEALYANIQQVGMPAWSDDDQRFAKAIQKEMKQEEKGLNAKPDSLGVPPKDEARKGGGSDDIGDVSWTLPTVTLTAPTSSLAATVALYELANRMAAA